MKKLTKALLIGGAMCVAYGIGKIQGHIECLDNIIEEHGDDIFKDTNEYVDSIGKFASITVIKPEEKETDDLNA